MAETVMYKGIEVVMLVVMFVMFLVVFALKNGENTTDFLIVDTITENHSHGGNDGFPRWE